VKVESSGTLESLVAKGLLTMFRIFSRLMSLNGTGTRVVGVTSFVLATSLVSGLVHAQQPMHYKSGYMGASVQSYDYTDSSIEDASPTAFRLQLGTEISDGLDFELHYGVGLSEEDVSSTGGPVSFEIDSFRALYFKPKLPMNELVTAYALAGYAEGKVLARSTVSSAQQRLKEYGPSYGFGVSFELSPISRMNVEFVRLLEEESLDASSLGVGINLDF